MKNIKDEHEVNLSFASEIKYKSGQDLFACFQCRKCAAGCPVAEDAGLSPDQLIRSILFGDEEEALRNRLIWQCVSCFLCGARCPNGIQTARINETLRQMARERGLQPSLPEIASFHDSFMKSVSHLGRANEVEVMLRYSLQNAKRTGGLRGIVDEVKKNASLGRSMLQKGRVHLGLEKVKDRAEMKALCRKKQKG